MRIVFVASEGNPFIKSGGLGDVIGSLPKALQEEKQECIVVLPKYQDMKMHELLEYVTHFHVWVGWRQVYCGILKAVYQGVTYYFIDNEQYFRRPGLYGYHDDYERFAFFNIAVLELIGHLQLQPDVLHLHDWQTAMIATLYKEKYQYYRYYEQIKIVFTIHNIAYQGKADPTLISDMFGLPMEIYNNGNCRHNDCLNMMKSALIYSDSVTTVSPTYAKEICTKQYGEGLESVLQMRRSNLHGIINGIDETEYNPEKDLDIVHHFSKDTVFEYKPKNKVALQQECHLPVGENIPCIGVVSRLTWQKGVDLLLQKLEAIVALGTQVIILGAGDFGYEQAFLDIARRNPKQVSFQQKYDFALAKRIYASCDMFLMPSLFEPCGLSQMMALRFGTLPIVRETGGLLDSVEAYNKYTQEGNGFRFSRYDGEDMYQCVAGAIWLYQNQPEVWHRLVQQAMTTSLCWRDSAREYIKLYA